MKKTLTLGTLFLGCCLAAVAQTGSTPNQTPPTSTPSTFPQDQTGQTPSNPSMPSNPSAIPPDTNAPGQISRDAASQTSNPQPMSLSGCLNQAADGAFMLKDSSGNTFRLQGDTSQFSSYVDKEVKVTGVEVTASVASMSSSSSSTSAADGTSAPMTQFNVSEVHKVSDSCSTRQ